MKKQALFFPILGTTLLLTAGAVYQTLGNNLFSIISSLGSVALFIIWLTFNVTRIKTRLAGNRGKYGAPSMGSLVLTILVLIGLAFLANRPRFNISYDTTSNQTNTLSPQSIKTLASVNDKIGQVEVIAFFHDDSLKSQFKNLLELFQRSGAKFNISIYDPVEAPIKATKEKITTADTVIFRSDQKDARITVFNEEKVTNALLQLSQNQQKKIYFSQGHGEPEIDSTEPDGISFSTTALTNNNYHVQPLNIITRGNIPDDADLLVILGPKYDFKDTEIKLLKDKMLQGLSIMLLIDSMVPTVNLNHAINDFGLSFSNDFLLLSPDDPRVKLIGQNHTIVDDFNSFHQITKDFSSGSTISVITKNTRSIATNELVEPTMTVADLGSTRDDLIRVRSVTTRNDLENIKENQIETGASHLVFAISEGLVGGAKLALNTQDPQDTLGDSLPSTSPATAKSLRIFAGGSSSIARNGTTTQGENLDLFTSAVQYLVHDSDLISIRPKNQELSSLNLNSDSSQIILALISFVYPIAFLIMGTLYWLKRSNA